MTDPAQPVDGPATPAALSWCAAALWALLVLLWLAAVRGLGLPEALSRAALLGALAATAGALLLASWRAVSRDRGAAILLGLVVLALAVRLLGIDHEVAERYYLDEGTYAHHATDIDRGELLIDTFVYPHLVYYLDAFVLWAASLFGGLVARTSAALFGISDWAVVCRLLMRSVSALLGALTVVPVFRIARIAAAPGGRAAALLGGLLIVFSPLYDDGSHLAICDVPSAFFATLALWLCARLLERETRRGYLLAGAAAGLAAAAKYPAGLVAIAIVAVWLRGCWRERRLAAGVLWAAASALFVFLLCNPSLLVTPRLAFFGERGIFFGVFQYAGEGWLGVVPRSRTLYYLEALAESFGWPALLAGACGLAIAVRRDARRTVLWLLPFPAGYLALLLAMTVAVRRNLYPVLPALAALLGVGLATSIAALAALPRLRGAAPRMRQTVLAAALLLLPMAATVRQTVGLSRPGTRVVAREWIRAHVPRGAAIVKDTYTPDLDPAEYVTSTPKGVRFVGQLPEEALRAAHPDLILVSAAAYQRFFDPESAGDAEALAIRARYERIFRSAPPIARFEPGRFRLGPSLALYRAVPGALGPPLSGALLRAADAFVPDRSMREKGSPRVRYGLDGQWVMLRVRLLPGRYRLAVDRPLPGPGAAWLVDLADRELARSELAPSGTALLDVPVAERLFLYLQLPRDGSFETLTLSPPDAG